MLKNNNIRKKFHRNGFIILKNFIPKKLINNLQRDTNKLVKKMKNNASYKSDFYKDVHYLKSGELSSVHNINNHMNYHKRFFHQTKITKVFKKIYGEPSKKWFNSSYFLKPKGKGIATKAHQDNAFFNLKPVEAITCWIPVNNVNKKNSPLFYYLGSNKEGNVKHIYDGNLGASLCVTKNNISKIKKKYKKVYITLKKGDCIVHGPLVVHGSEKNSGFTDRAAFNFSIKSNKAKFQNKGVKNYYKNLNLFLKRKKNRQYKIY